MEVVQGEFRRASQNKELGVFLLEGSSPCLLFKQIQATTQYFLSGISPAPAGIPQIEVEGSASGRRSGLTFGNPKVWSLVARADEKFPDFSGHLRCGQ